MGEVKVRLTFLPLLDRNQLHDCMKQFFIQFQNKLVLTSKDEEVSAIDTSHFRVLLSSSMVFQTLISIWSLAGWATVSH